MLAGPPFEEAKNRPMASGKPASGNLMASESLRKSYRAAECLISAACRMTRSAAYVGFYPIDVAGKEKNPI